MRVSDIELVPNGATLEFGASVESRALPGAFRLRVTLPATDLPASGANCGDALLVALLLPAMRTGERLVIPAAVSPKLRKAVARIQTIFRSWEPTLSWVEVEAPIRELEHPEAKRVGLFFSCGLDASYSFAKNLFGHPLNEDTIDTLISLHGLDILEGDGKDDVFRELLENTRQIAAETGRSVLAARSNLRELTDRLLISWCNLGHGTVLASTGLLMAGRFRRLYLSSSEVLREIYPSGTHPLLDPLWSTETLTFVHDGCEADRLEKTRFVAKWPGAMNRLRVCWARETGEYNCGRCAKCVKAMLTLHVVGAAESCPTLPARVDPERVRDMHILGAGELPELYMLLKGLGRHERNRELREALETCIARATNYFARLNRARETMDEMIPLADKFVWVDGEDVREKMGTGRKALPFLEKDGVWNGYPADDGTAIHELQRLRMEGARFIAFWCGHFWWFDRYREFTRHLRTNYEPVLENEALAVFALDRSAAGAVRR